MWPCNVPDCPGHRKPHQVSVHQIWEKYHQRGRRKLIATIKAVEQQPAPLLETTALLGTATGWKRLAKTMKIKCYTRMTREELAEAIQCVKTGAQERLEALEAVARQRSQAAWDVWRQKRNGSTEAEQQEEIRHGNIQEESRQDRHDGSEGTAKSASAHSA